MFGLKSFMQGWEVCADWNLQFEISGKAWSVSCNQLGDIEELLFVCLLEPKHRDFNFSSSLTSIVTSRRVQGQQ